MRTLLIVQARMTSTRLPGKVMKQVLDKPLLHYLIERLKRVVESHIVIATTTNEEDQPIVDFCSGMGVSVFRGSEEDVLSRYVRAAKKYEGDIVVRITADCPLIDPDIIDECILKLIQTDCDYVSNTHQRTYPKGMDVEAMKKSVLTTLDTLAESPYDREHVTPYIKKHAEKFKISQITMTPNVSDMRLTVDTEEDFQKVKMIIESLYSKKNDFSLEDILTTVGAK